MTASPIFGMVDPARARQWVASVIDNPASLAPVEEFKTELARRGVTVEGDLVERSLLACAARDSEPRLESLNVDESVKQLLRQEYAEFEKPARTPVYLAGTTRFSAACKMATLRRFPAGAMDWEVGGFPRSWLLKTKGMDRVRAAWFLATQVGGIFPMYFLHVAHPPRNRLLIVEKDVERMFGRVARSMALQPEIKGIIASAWFHDPRSVQEYPHLQWINRPYEEHGGLIVLMGPAEEDSGMLTRNRERRERYVRGELGYRLGTAIWPRAAALKWVESSGLK